MELDTEDILFLVRVLQERIDRLEQERLQNNFLLGSIATEELDHTLDMMRRLTLRLEPM